MLDLWRQDQFDPSRVFIQDATPHWATLTLAGPKARALMARLDFGIALDDAAMPHLSVVQKDRIDSLISGLQAAALGDDRVRINAAMNELELATKEFAALRMDKSIRKAFAGKRIESLDEEVSGEEHSGEHA